MATILKKKEGKSEVSEKPAKAKLPRLSEVETPVKPADRDGDRFGATLGLRLNETFIKVLEENENPKKGHKPDTDLIKFFVDEFHNRNNTNILYNIREIRWRYNTGRLTPDTDGNPVPPEIQSFQYDTDGKLKEKKLKTGASAEELAMKLEDRQKVERERRAKEDDIISKLQARIDKSTERVTARREAWEGRNGELPEETPAKVEKSEKKFKKAK